MQARHILLYLAIEHQNNWDDIYNDIKNKRYIEAKKVEEAVKNFKANYITILDKNYPEDLKRSYRPPFVIFPD